MQSYGTCLSLTSLFKFLKQIWSKSSNNKATWFTDLLYGSSIQDYGTGGGTDTNQFNGIENSETDPHEYVQQIFSKGTKAL